MSKGTKGKKSTFEAGRRIFWKRKMRAKRALGGGAQGESQE